MIFELYNETPLHRDNFINLAMNKVFDSLLFYRVINKFMIQGGDLDIRKAQRNDIDASCLVNAEFNSELFHKKGVLAAARDDHPL
jgi:cyclophilin family peptidyl-prolyl cis-trans isomerase